MRQGAHACEMYRDWRVHVGAVLRLARAAPTPTARPGCPSPLTRQGSLVHTTAGGWHGNGRAETAAADSSLLLAGTKDAFIVVDVRVTGACIEVELRHPEVAWG